MLQLRRLPWLVPVLALVLGLIGPQEARPASFSPRATAPGTPDRVPEVLPAHELWARPAEHVGKLLSLEVQFESELEAWNPMLTRFSPGVFRGFKAWSEEQYLWHEADFRAPLVRVFARRGGAAEWALADSARFGRFELLCRVQSNFAGEPWVEVLAVKPRPRRMQSGSLIHAVRALEFVEKRLWKAALGEFERADSPGLPKRAHTELQRLVELCRKRLPRLVHEHVDNQ
jgi:hypothetical protein